MTGVEKKKKRTKNERNKSNKSIGLLEDWANVINSGDVFEEWDEIEEFSVVLIIEPGFDGDGILSME
jgi:hypothetical protein